MGGHYRYEGALAPALRRVTSVTITVSADDIVAEVHGIGHRHPVHLPINLGLASWLVRAGAPLCVHADHGSPPLAATGAATPG